MSLMQKKEYGTKCGIQKCTAYTNEGENTFVESFIFFGKFV